MGRSLEAALTEEGQRVAGNRGRGGVGGWSPRAWGRPKDTRTGVSPLHTTAGQ